MKIYSLISASIQARSGPTPNAARNRRRRRRREKERKDKQKCWNVSTTWNKLDLSFLFVTDFRCALVSSLLPAGSEIKFLESGREGGSARRSADSERRNPQQTTLNWIEKNVTVHWEPSKFCSFRKLYERTRAEEMKRMHNNSWHKELQRFPLNWTYIDTWSVHEFSGSKYNFFHSGDCNKCRQTRLFLPPLARIRSARRWFCRTKCFERTSSFRICWTW